MKGLLVRIAADQSEGGGFWNGPVDGSTGEYVYVPIPDDGPFHPGMATPYSTVAAHLGGRWPVLPPRLAGADMHLDPDFSHLTYGDQGQRAVQIKGKLVPGDFIVFYAGLRDIHSRTQLVYAIIGLLVIDGPSKSLARECAHAALQAVLRQRHRGAREARGFRPLRAGHSDRAFSRPRLSRAAESIGRLGRAVGPQRVLATQRASPGISRCLAFLHVVSVPRGRTCRPQ